MAPELAQMMHPKCVNMKAAHTGTIELPLTAVLNTNQRSLPIFIHELICCFKTVFALDCAFSRLALGTRRIVR